MPDASLQMDVDELVSYLAHTTIPTLLVEGDGDKALLRRIEQELIQENIDLMPLGGKGSLQNVYVRRHELASSPVAFLRDRDECAVVDMPTDWGDYVLTAGYSIENDVIDRAVIGKLAGAEFPVLLKLVTLMAEWFRAVLQDYVQNGRKAEIARDVSAVLDGDALSKRSLEEVSQVALAEPFTNLDLDHDSWRWLRGKSLLRVIHHFFSSRDPSYGKDQLIDLSIRLGPSESFCLLVERIKAKFN